TRFSRDWSSDVCSSDLGLNRAWLAGDQAGGDYLIFLHGTTWVTKHWPELYWRRLAELAAEQGMEVRLPWGNDSEKARAQRIAERSEERRVGKEGRAREG